MDIPPIRYTRTSDGVNLAYFTAGAGEPLLHLPAIGSHLELHWRLPELRDMNEWLATNRTLIRFDARNIGLSTRGVERVSLADRAIDIDAVLDATGTHECILLAHGASGPLAMYYAATRAERISKFVLVNSVAVHRDALSVTPALKALQAVFEYDWETFTELVAGVSWAWSETGHAFAVLLRESASPADWARQAAQTRTEDVTPYVTKIRAPTLVVHSRQAVATTAETGAEIASAIPGSRLITLDGRAVGQANADTHFRRAVDEFLRGTLALEVPSSTPLRTVLFTDLVGHTEMMSRLGDERGREVLREHERITREVLKAHGGTEVKTMGDGFMASFGSVTKAVECGIALQRAFEEWNASERAQQAAPLRVRVGLNAGEPIEEEGPDGQRDLFGATVILASRIAAKAEGGEILVADTVRGLCSGKGFLFSDRGEFVAKGFEEPVRVYEVRWRE